MTPFSIVPIPATALAVLRRHTKAAVASVVGITQAAAAKSLRSGRARRQTVKRYELAAKILATEREHNLCALMELAQRLLPTAPVNEPYALYSHEKLATACRRVIRAQRHLQDVLRELEEA